MSYTPELGQGMFSNTPWQELPAQARVVAVIDEISTQLVQRGLASNEIADNMGGQYVNDTFRLRSYCWCDGAAPGHENGCPPNFEYGDLKVCWYKHSHRSGSQNREMSSEEVRAMRDACLQSLEGLPPRCQWFYGCEQQAVQRLDRSGQDPTFYCDDHRITVTEVGQ